MTTLLTAKETFFQFAIDHNCKLLLLEQDDKGKWKKPIDSGWSSIEYVGLSVEDALEEHHIGIAFHGDLCAIDLDVKNANGIGNFKNYLAQLGMLFLFDTLFDTTPSGGLHLFYILLRENGEATGNRKWNDLGIEYFIEGIQTAFYDNLQGDEILEITPKQLQQIATLCIKQPNPETGSTDRGSAQKHKGKTDQELLNYCAKPDEKARHDILKWIICAQAWFTRKSDEQITETLIKCNSFLSTPLEFDKTERAWLKRMITWAREHSEHVENAKKIYFDKLKSFYKIEAPFSIYNADLRAIQDRAQFRAHREQSPDNFIEIGGGDKPRTLNLVSLWMRESPNVIHGVCYRPDKNPYAILEEKGLKKINLFSGFIEPSDDGCCFLFLDFVRVIVCKNSVTVFSWLCNWMARIIQFPTDRVHVYALALNSPQGCGKNFFFETLGKLLGENFVKLARMEDVLEFNSLLANKLLVYLDECIFSANQRENNRLKDLITGTTLTINQKFLAQYTIENFITIGSGTNASFTAPIEDNDRRWVCLELSRDHMKDNEYFGKIADQMEKENGYAKLMKVLLDYNISWEILDNYPKTETYYENRRLWLMKNKPVLLFLHETVNDEDSYLTNPVLNSLRNNKGFVPSRVFMDEFNDWLKATGAKDYSAKYVLPHLRELLQIPRIECSQRVNEVYTRGLYLNTIEFIKNKLKGYISNETHETET